MFGSGGFGGGHGGGFGGHGGNGGGPGGHGPGFGGPGHGPGGFHGSGFHGGFSHAGFFGGIIGLGHFGPSISGNAGDADNPNNISPAHHRFPDAALVYGAADTGLARVDQFIINYHSLRRALIWLAGLCLALSTLLVIFTTLTIPNPRVWWIFFISPAFVLSALAYTLRTFTDDFFGTKFTTLACLVASALTLIVSLICALCGIGSLRIAFASPLAFFISSFVGNYTLYIVRRSQEIRGFDDDSRAYRARSIGASSISHAVELLIFSPLAFAGQHDFFWIVWFMICTFCFSIAIEFALCFIAHPLRVRLTHHLSATYDYIDDPLPAQSSAQ